jgi:TonB family protein
VKPSKAPPKDSLPDLDSKGRRRKAEAPLPQATQPVSRSQTASGGADSVGLDIGGTPGLGVPDGTAVGGDWYIAGVIQKIRALWQQQLAAAAMPQPVIVKLTIQADGSIGSPVVVVSSGVFTVDQAALRSIYSAAPFRELPKEHGTTLTIQLRFLSPGR